MCFSHKSGNPFGADVKAAIFKLYIHSRASVAIFMAPLYLADAFYKLFILAAMAAFIAMIPRVVSRNAYFQDFRHLLYRPLVPIIIDELEYFYYFPSREKMVTAFLVFHSPL